MIKNELSRIGNESGSKRGLNMNSNTYNPNDVYDPKSMDTNISLLPTKTTNSNNECVINYSNPSDTFVEELRAYFKAILGSSIVEKMFSLETLKLTESIKSLTLLRSNDWNKFKNHFSFL